MMSHMLVLFGTLFLIAASAFATDTSAVLDQQLCSVCHGPGGTTSSELFPQLAAQPVPYFLSQMKAFRDKSRQDENAKRFMWGIASRLSDDEIQHLAAYFEAQTAAHKGEITDQLKYETGKSIFTRGNPKKNVPACMSCHGAKGEGKDATPRLGGQHEAYLKRQLKVFYGSDRPAAVAMHEVVKGLSESDIDAIAHYLQAQ